jgi:predicted aspartyl protease
VGKVITSARIENIEDLYDVEKGTLSPPQIRAVEVHDALLDTGATMLSLPNRLVQQLGLKRLRTRRARTTSGVREFAVYGTVQLTVQGRDCRVDVAAIPDDCPVLIGQVPLELLNFVVDPNAQRMVGNPDHGGEPMIDLFSQAQQDRALWAGSSETGAVLSGRLRRPRADAKTASQFYCPHRALSPATGAARGGAVERDRKCDVIRASAPNCG